MIVIQRAWGEAETQELTALWREGLSAAQIARTLAPKFGFRSRNAIIGRVHRLGLGGRATPHAEATKLKISRARRAASQPKPVKPPRFKPAQADRLPSDLEAARALAPIDPALSILGLTNFTCRFPIGDPQEAGFTFCGRTCNNVENPYCIDHAKLAYVPVKKRQHDGTARLANWLDRRTFTARAA